MSRRREREIANNHTNKRGEVIERDGKNARVRVRFPDEDETRSFWIDVPGSGSSASASFDMPDVEDEVWVGLDPSGEGGVVIGTRYNAKNRPAQTDPDVTQKNFRDGSKDSHDPGSGTRTIDAQTMDLGPDGRTPAAGIGHLVHVTFGSSMGMHPIATGSPSVNVKE